MFKKSQAVRVRHAHLKSVRHPLRVARLIYSAPSWVLAGPLYIVAAIVLSSLAFSFWAKKDDLVMAPIILERESVTIEAVGTGMIAGVNVKEGVPVDILSPLLTVQRTRITNASEQELLSGQQESLKRELRDADREYEARRQELDEQLKSHATEVRHEQDQLEVALKSTTKDRQLLEKRISDNKRDINHLNSKLKDAKRKAGRLSKLFRTGDITRMDMDRANDRAKDLQKAVNDKKSEAAKLEIAQKTLQLDRQTLINKQKQLKIRNTKQIALLGREKELNKTRFDTTRQDIEDQQKATTSKMEAEQGLVAGVEHKDLQSFYTSPFKGLVTQVHVKPGQNIGAGSPLVTLVRRGANLEGRLMVQNKDIGRLEKGQTVRIKYYAFPFQEYGIPEGIITHISTKPAGDKEGTSQYLVRVALNKYKISKHGGHERDLSIGLEGSVEIKTGQKRLIELVFAPISKFFTQEEG
ncbi:MAG: HlyD family efflux transporter periplasmic adaptor subunit [Magnetococcales bacterium]|nr:HlyD family efflux transporter periplasmic adaptor subunit [Magnetococcales bacterium]